MQMHRDSCHMSHDFHFVCSFVYLRYKDRFAVLPQLNQTRMTHWEPSRAFQRFLFEQASLFKYHKRLAEIHREILLLLRLGKSTATSKHQQMVSVCFLLSHTRYNVKSRGWYYPRLLKLTVRGCPDLSSENVAINLMQTFWCEHSTGV